MLCPYCHHTNHLEIDMHSDGYSSTALIECTACGALLSMKETTLVTVHGPTGKTQEKVAAAI